MLTAGGMIALLKALMPQLMAQGPPFLRDVGIHAHTLLFAGAVALVASGLLALTPVLRLALKDIHTALSEGGRTAAGRFWRRSGRTMRRCAGSITRRSKAFYRRDRMGR